MADGISASGGTTRKGGVRARRTPARAPLWDPRRSGGAAEAARATCEAALPIDRRPIQCATYPSSGRDDAPPYWESPLPVLGARLTPRGGAEEGAGCTRRAASPSAGILAPPAFEDYSFRRMPTAGFASARISDNADLRHPFLIFLAPFVSFPPH